MKSKKSRSKYIFFSKRELKACSTTLISVQLETEEKKFLPTKRGRLEAALLEGEMKKISESEKKFWNFCKRANKQVNGPLKTRTVDQDFYPAFLFVAEFFMVTWKRPLHDQGREERREKKEKRAVNAGIVII